MQESTIYIRMRNRVYVKPNKVVKLHEIAQLAGSPDTCREIRELIVYEISPEDKSLIVIDVMKVIQTIQQTIGNMDIQTIGPSQTIVQIEFPKRNFSIIYFLFVWLLLFVGAALAIMNFHEDVSMQAVHQRIYKIVTGRENNQPLLLQIPYSIGLGVGMILFFNHLFKKRLNEEPSPLEVEIFNYQQDLDQYVIIHENKESEKKVDGH
ncbi:stage V sporulation protein AA [Bacillus taeanensis]|uniref:Stage V sporulation protein AA n=1 Tax=Bacillus taeanensis TaxID=273032 RepID=A0A366Y003_9BACI|nr:stage V sporulation protein AA [Bacillus taeanensis]RBW70369.1 stage V sporulation protein AA [Bacillus taeanensis]